MRSRLPVLSAIIGICLQSCGAALAQPYPNRPIKLIVPFPAGGTVDIVGRQAAQQLSTALGQTVVVENRPGAGTTIGLKAVATAEPDGYTLLLGSTASLAINPALYKTIDFSPVRNLAPVGMLVTLANLLGAATTVPVNNVKELIAYAKANPGKLTFGASLGAPPHLLGEFFRARAGLDIPFIPYRGTALALPDFLAGQIQLTAEGVTVLTPFIQQGKLRPMVVTGTVRLPELPDVPTLDEIGLTGYPTEGWIGIVGPPGTPASIVGKLNAVINESLKSPETQASLAKLGFHARPGSPQEFAGRIATDSEKWAAVVKLTGVKID